MSIRDHKSKCRRAMLLVATSLLALHLQVFGQGRGLVAPVTPAQVTQAVSQIRASSTDEKILAQALEIGGVLLREGRFAEALELFGALAEKTPQDPDVLYGQALAMFNVGRVAEAEPLAHKAVDTALAASTAEGINKLAVSRRAADALVLLAVVLAVRGNDAGALEAVQKAVELAPDNFDAQLALGRVLFGMGDDTGATRAFRVANRLMPANGQALFYLATSLERASDVEGALSTYRELILRQPAMSEGHLGLGVMLVKRGGSEMEEGIKELHRALQIDPNIYEARITLGRTLVTQGRAEEAIEQLRRAAELAPANPEPHYQLSLAYRRLGNKDQAAAESEIVKHINESRRGVKLTGNSDQPR